VPELLSVALAGALGATCRWKLGAWAQASALGTTRLGPLPVGTLLVNVLGCLALGLLAGAASTGVPARWRLAVGTGFLGSFTTFSTFSVETVQLAQAGSLGLAALNLSLQLLLGGAAALAGLALGRALGGMG